MSVAPLGAEALRKSVVVHVHAGASNAGSAETAGGQGWSHSLLGHRLRHILGDKSFRTIAIETNSCAETVRRYLNGAPCSVEFISKVCIRYGVCAEWLLFGRGEPNADAVDQVAQLNQVTPSELLREVARRWEAIERELDVMEERREL